jgi:hypothetical protein
VISIRASSHEQLAAGSSKLTLHRRRRPRSGQPLDRSVEGESNESTKQPAEWWVEAGSGLGGRRRQRPALQVEAAAQQAEREGHPRGKRRRGGRNRRQKK